MTQMKEKMAPEPLLETRGLTKSFGGLMAVSQLDMRVNTGEIVGLIGPNGAGKTTTFNLITGVHRPTEGKIFFNGRNITARKPHAVAGLGIGRTFQLASLFPDFTVLENVLGLIISASQVRLLGNLVQHVPISPKRGSYFGQVQGNIAACGSG